MKKRHYIYTFLYFILLLGVLAGTYFFYKEILSIKEVAIKKQSDWQLEEDRRNEIKNLERSIKDLAEERKELNSHFVSGEDPVAFLNSLEEMAISVGAIAEVSTVDKSKENSDLIVNLKVSGGFDSLYKFVTLIENSHYVMEIKNLSMSTSISDVKNLNSNKWDMNVQLKLITFSNI